MYLIHSSVLCSEQMRKIQFIYLRAKFCFLKDIFAPDSLDTSFFFLTVCWPLGRWFWSPKRFHQASLPISTGFFSKQNYKFLPWMYSSRCSQSAVRIGKNVFPNGIMKYQKYRRFIFPDVNYCTRWSLELVISFSRIYI